jgi:hypothetical protein
MRTAIIALIASVALFSAGAALCAESESANARPYIGILLDSTPLPDLLIKHLGLSPGQGIRIKNVHLGTPADKAGLERDDIIIGFQGEDVDDCERFVDEVREAAVGTEVSLEIIHLGKRKTVKLKLERFKGDLDLKYPPEPEIVQSWRPGKIFRLRPGDKDWIEILRDDVILRDGVPPEFRVNIDRFFKELHTYHHSNGESYTVTIEGNPSDEDSTITVSIGDTEYKTTLREIGKLPEKYRESAEQALKNARKSSKGRKLGEGVTVPSRRTPRDWRYYFEKLYPHSYSPPAFGPGDQVFDKIQKQMRELQQRLEKLEKRHKEMPDRSPEELDEQEPQEQKKSIQPERKEQQRV